MSELLAILACVALGFLWGLGLGCDYEKSRIAPYIATNQELSERFCLEMGDCEPLHLRLRKETK